MKTIEEEIPPAVKLYNPDDLRGKYDDLRARAVEMERAQQWRPIAEAPRDGTSVLLGWSGHDDWTCTACWSEGGWSADNYLEWMTQPTHFRPLPPAPDTQQTNK